MPYRPPNDRAYDAKLAQDLKSQGLSVTAVARRLGLPRSTVSDLINHPSTGELYRHRKRQYQLCKCGRRKSYGAYQCKTCRRS